MRIITREEEEEKFLLRHALLPWKTSVFSFLFSSYTVLFFRGREKKRYMGFTVDRLFSFSLSFLKGRLITAVCVLPSLLFGVPLTSLLSHSGVRLALVIRPQWRCTSFILYLNTYPSSAAAPWLQPSTTSPETALPLRISTLDDPFSLRERRALWAKSSLRNYFDLVQVSSAFTCWWDPRLPRI